MSRGGGPYTDIQAGFLTGEEDKSYISLGERLGNEGSLRQALLLEVEDPTANNISQQVVGAHGACHDRRWASAFKVNVITTIVGAFCFGNQAFEAISSDQNLGELGGRRLSGESEAYTLVPVFFGGLALFALGGGIAWGILHSHQLREAYHLDIDGLDYPYMAPANCEAGSKRQHLGGSTCRLLLLLLSPFLPPAEG